MAKLPQIRLDGTIRFFEPPTRVPEGWTASPGDPLVYLPPWEPCKHRVLNRNNRTMTIVPLCGAKGATVDHATCIGCPMRVVPDEGHYVRMHPSQAVTVTDLPDPRRPPDLQHGTIVYQNGPPPVPTNVEPAPPEVPASVLRHHLWKPIVPKAAIPYSHLADLEATLPPHKEGRDRPLRFEPNGSIVYEQEEGEPPKDINGYQRDPANPFRFTPLWPDCRLRHQTAVRFANCGCIDVIMRCNHPEMPVFGDRISHTQCENCPKRKPWEG